jgi:hypothetical protein
LQISFDRDFTAWFPSEDSDDNQMGEQAPEWHWLVSGRQRWGYFQVWPFMIAQLIVVLLMTRFPDW